MNIRTIGGCKFASNSFEKYFGAHLYILTIRIMHFVVTHIGIQDVI